MAALDHLILRVTNASASVRFYVAALDFSYGGSSAPFEVVRVNDGFNIDLLEEVPSEKTHLAFRLSQDDFERSKRSLAEKNIKFGSEPFVRDGRVGRQQGARGMQPAIYFYDPDGHNIEIRCDEHSHGPRDC